MPINLIYKHQQKTYEIMQENLKNSRKAAYVFPVGCGKSFPALKYIEDNPEKNVLIVTPSRGIINQFKKYIKEYLSNGGQLLKDKKIAIETYSKVSFMRKKARNIKPDIIIFDEIHRIGAETWEKAVDSLIKEFSEAEIIGMSATPERMDKRNMAYEKFGDNVIYEMSLAEALSGEKEDEVVLKTPKYVRILSELKEEIKQYKEQIDEIEDEEKRKKYLKNMKN